MLPDAAAVTSVAIGQGMLAALSQGTIWAQMGTIGVRATQWLAASVADQRSDVLFVDAPVSGSRQPAEAGHLLILASGPESTRAVLAPVFGAIGSRTLWLG
jgi:3-hydroxyisobutyrate dehydrogenase